MGKKCAQCWSFIWGYCYSYSSLVIWCDKSPITAGNVNCVFVVSICFIHIHACCKQIWILEASSAKVRNRSSPHFFLRGKNLFGTQRCLFHFISRLTATYVLFKISSLSSIAVFLSGREVCFSYFSFIDSPPPQHHIFVLLLSSLIQNFCNVKLNFIKWSLNYNQ